MISETYATGKVVVGSNGIAGGLVAENAAITTDSYWDILSTGQAHSSGSADSSGLSTATLKSGLPNGFDSTIWDSNPNINNGYPFFHLFALFELNAM
jgi:hypothetical protein